MSFRACVVHRTYVKQNVTASSLLVITYEVLDMACRSVLSNLNCIKRHLLTEFYLVSAIDIFVVRLGINFVFS